MIARIWRHRWLPMTISIRLEGGSINPSHSWMAIPRRSNGDSAHDLTAEIMNPNMQISET